MLAGLALSLDDKVKAKLHAVALAVSLFGVNLFKSEMRLGFGLSFLLLLSSCFQASFSLAGLLAAEEDEISS